MSEANPLEMIGDRIYWRYRKAQAKILKESGGDRSNEIHVSDLVYPCLRRAWYGKKYPFMMDSRTMGILWSGVVGHEKMPLKKKDGEFNELPLEYVFKSVDGEEIKIVGRADDVIREFGEWGVVDKKFVNSLPRDVREHHKLQVVYYGVMLRKQYNITPTWGAVLYIEMDRTGQMNPRPMVFKITEQMLNEAEKLMRERALILYEAMKYNRPPPRVRTWLCDGYCPFLSICASGGEEDE